VKRKSIPLLTKLASALLQLRDDQGQLLIPYQDSKLMTADQVVSLFHFDHYPVRHEDGGPADPWNLVPRMILEHRRKTAKVDAPEAAKGRKVRKAADHHQARMAAKSAGIPKPQRPTRKILSRPFSIRPTGSKWGQQAKPRSWRRK
jgi:hypothetical protein